MKKGIFSLLLVFAGSALTNVAVAQEEVVAQEIKTGAHIEFEKNTHDYGTVKYDGPRECEFVFTNTGTDSLEIKNAKGSCGCTVPDWPREAIAPGESAVIKVSYDMKRPGAINKSVTITSNAVNDPVKVIRIKGNVLPKPTSGAPTSTSGAPVN